MRRLLFALAAALAGAALTPHAAVGDSISPGGYSGAKCSEWRRLRVPNDAPLPELRDVCAAGKDLFVVGTHGAFFRLRGANFERIAAPTRRRLNVVWARTRNEVYAAGEEGTVLLFNGKKLTTVGSAPRTFQSRGPFGRTETHPVDIAYVWASAPNDVYVTCPGLLLHYDGRSWRPIEIGAGPVVVRTMTVTGSDVVYPTVGPIWGSSSKDVWVGYEVVDRNARLNHRWGPRPPGSSLTPPSFHASHFDGAGGKCDPDVLKVESWARRGGGQLVPELIQNTPGMVFCRFGGSIHRWDSGRWLAVTALPNRQPNYWSRWSAADSGHLLILDYADLRIWNGSRWFSVRNPPDLGGMAIATALTDEDVVGLIDGRDKDSLVVGRIQLPSR